MIFFFTLFSGQFAVAANNLNIAKPGSGFGVVSSGDANINCGADCTGSYAPSTAVTLTATPDAASFSNFVQWGPGACALAGQNSTCALNTTASDQTVAATFSGAAIAGGYYHTVALKSDGTVWAWGHNGYGQLGDGTYYYSNGYSYSYSSTPVQVSNLSNVLAIAGGYFHTVALKSDGTVWAWGLNGYGQLGNGSFNSSNIPVQVSSLSNVIAIAGGNGHTVALKSNGTVWAWGNNGFGQLGDNQVSGLWSKLPVAVSSLSNIIAIAGGDQHTVALKSDGTVWAWGWNNYGQLGNGSYTSSNIPVAVSGGLSNVIAIAGSTVHTVALKSDGTVWAWGYNCCGQLGDNGVSGNFSNIPVAVSGLSNVIAIAGGGGHTVALKSDGTVWAWGINDYGQLGDNQVSGTWSKLPVAVSGLSNVIAIAGGGVHTVALKSDGTVWAWGYNLDGHGLLGDNGVSGGQSNTPVQVHGVGNVGFLRLFPASQTITFGAAPTVVFGGNGTVSATATSGLTVTFTSQTTGVCTVSGTTVTSVAAGTCTIAANQAGNSDYLAAPQVTQTFSVGQASQSIGPISFNPVTLTAGGTTTVSASGGASGNSVTFTSQTTGVCTVSGSIVTGVAIGTCTIAANQAGDANYSAAPQVTEDLTVGQGSQTITFGAAPTVVVGDTGAVSATATSSLAVTFTSQTTGVCTVSGNTVTGVTAGTCTIAANQAGDANYTAATQVTQNLTVGQASQTITFGVAPTVVVGGTGAVSATATSSLAVTFTSQTTGVCTVSGSTVTGVMAGTCTIAVNQAGDANYSAAPQVTQNLTVGQASQTITFGAAPTVVVGDTGTVSATATSGLAVTFTSQTTGVCTISGSTVTGVTAGTCTIAANQAGDANYSAAPQVTQDLTVGQASQTITFGVAPTVVVGGTGAVSAVATSGLAVTFTSQTTGVCTVSGSTVTGVMAGTCTIAANQAGNANYNVAPQVTQNLTVGAINQTIGAISFNPATLAVGGTTTASATATSGLAVTFSSTTPSICTVSGSTVTGVATGACTIAANQAGNASYTAAPQVTQNLTVGAINQTIGAISFNPATLAVGGTTTASATATSGLAVTFSSTTPSICTVSGSTVTGVAAGTCTIAANQAGNASYTAATQVTRNISVISTAFVLTVTKTGIGSGTVSGGGSYAAGATVTLTATPEAGSTFTGWSSSPCAATFTMPASALTCTATFKKISDLSPSVGVFRNGQWYLDGNANGAWDGCDTEFCFSGFGQAGDLPASGNWDGGSKSYIGVLRSGTGEWFVDRNGNRQWDGCIADGCYNFGATGDFPVAGDWSGNGVDTIGVFRNGQWFLDANGNGAWDDCGTDLCWSFGQTDDLPVAGNWDGGLKAGAGVFRAGTWYLDYNGNGKWDGCQQDGGQDQCLFNSFGLVGDLPAAGDWNGDGKAKVGVFRNGTWYLDYNGNGAWDGCGVDRCYEGSFGTAGDLPVAGKW